MIGAIGASFDTPEHDVQIARAGLAAVPRCPFPRSAVMTAVSDSDPGGEADTPTAEVGIRAMSSLLPQGEKTARAHYADGAL